MNKVSILDVSLRDGGHRSNFHFENTTLEAMLTLLDNAGIDCIEIGYRNGSIRPIANIGRAGLCDKAYLDACRSWLTKTMMAVMVHPANVSEVDMQELKDSGVGLIRICIPRGGVALACPVIDMVKAVGLQVSVNFIHASQYLEQDIDAVVERAMKHKPDIIYFADSNGSLMPERVKYIYEKYTQRYEAAFGFHAHDNIGMAQANTLAAIGAGAKYIDASLGGMGKGIGNLKTEFFIAYLHANKIKKHNLQCILDAANYARQALSIGQELIDMDEFVRGIHDLSTAEVKQFQVDGKLI